MSAVVWCTLYINRSFSGPIFRLCRSFSKGNCKTSFETSYGGKFWFSIWELPTHICIRNASIHFKIQIQKLIQQVGITNAHSLLVSQCLKLQNISNSSIMGLLFDTQGDTYLVDTFHQLFVSAKLKKTLSFQSLHKTWVETTLLFNRSWQSKSNTGRLNRICNYWIFFYWLCLSRSCLTHLMSMGRGALLFLAKSVTRNWTDWQDTQAVLFLLTLPHISFFCHFGPNISPKIAQVDGTHRLCQAKDTIW